MKKEFIADIKSYTEQHVKDPQVGDHFTEHFGSVALIEARNGDALMVRRTRIGGTKYHPEKEWGDPEPMMVDEFVKWASYGHGVEGYWIELIPPVWPDELMAGG